MICVLGCTEPVFRADSLWPPAAGSANVLLCCRRISSYPTGSESHIVLRCEPARFPWPSQRYVVCRIAMVLFPPFFCESDWVGIASLTKHCQTISPKEPKPLSGSTAMSLNACWSSPIAALDGKERQALRTLAAVKSKFLAHS